MSDQNFGRYPYYYGPQGRLVIVDSALEAVSRGSTTVGLKTDKFALLSSHIKPIRNLIEPSEKVFAIDDHVGATGSGYIGDIFRLMDDLRVEAQRHRLTYETPVDVGSLARHTAAVLHSYTIYAVRPQAASIIVAGADPTGIQMYQVDPSGTFFKGQAFAIGQESERAMDFIQQQYNPDMNVDQAVELSNKAIGHALNESPIIEHGVIEAQSKKFRKL